MTERDEDLTSNGAGDNLSRRAFLKLLMGFSVVVSALPLTPIARFFFATQRDINSSRKKIANVNDLPEGNTMVFFFPGEEESHRSFLTHLSSEYEAEAAGYQYANNGFVAYNTVCPHLQCPIELPDDDVFICPCHGGFFSVVNGTVLGGPAPRALPAIRLEIDEESGDIYAAELIGRIGYGRD